MEYLCVKSVKKDENSAGTAYFQLKVSAVRIVALSDELVDVYNFNNWIEVEQDEYEIDIYSRVKRSAIKWCLINDCKDGFGDADLKLRIGEINVQFVQGEMPIYEKIENLYNGCEIGTIGKGCLLCGIIAQYDIKPHWIKDKLLSSFAVPVLWQKELSEEEKKGCIESAFFSKGMRIEDGRSNGRDGFRRDSDIEYNDLFNEYNSSKGYSDDDFIDDVLDGDAESYWNID